MLLNCPYCGTPYDIDESLIPQGDVKVRCKKCSNIFIVNAETGLVAKAQDNFPHPPAGREDDVKSETPVAIETAAGNAHASPELLIDGGAAAEPASGLPGADSGAETSGAAGNAEDLSGPDDFKKTLIDKIDNALNEDDSAKKKSSRARKKEAAGKRKPVSQSYADANSKISPLQIIALTVFFLLMASGAGYVLVYLRIINLPFVPRNLVPDIISNLLSRF